MNNINKAMENLKEIKNKEEILDESLIWEMANIQPRTTGLKSRLYVTFDGKHINIHGPRVKVITPNYSKGFPIIEI